MQNGQNWKFQNHHATDRFDFHQKSSNVIEDISGKNMIFENLAFPHMKLMFEKMS